MLLKCDARCAMHYEQKNKQIKDKILKECA